MIKHALITGLGSGYAPVASGTFGSAVAVVIALGVWAAAKAWGVCPCGLDVAWVVMSLLALAGCVLWGPWAAQYFAGRCRKPGDPGQVVLDEWAGQWVALVALPLGDWKSTLIVMAVQFFLFRLFDVLKPPPGRQFEKLPGGWGIALDDIIAGIYANLVGQIIFRWCYPI